MQATDAVFYIAILIMSVVIHEVSHGFMAEYFGDKTARDAGRLTLNPLKHLDPVGSVIIPALLVLSNSPFLFGWAKPVPYNPNNLSDRKWGTIAVASAGILANLLLAVIFGILIRLAPTVFGLPVFDPLLPHPFYLITKIIVVINLALAIFNLIPIPPLDGSKILFSFLPKSFEFAVMRLEQYSFVLLIIFIAFFSQYLYPVLSFTYHLITGLSL